MGGQGLRPDSCLRQHMTPREPFRASWRALSTSLSTIVVLILLPAIAFASPPDPSWSAGFYDGADGDDVVALVYEMAAANAAALLPAALLSCLPEISPEDIVRGLPGGCVTLGPRGPPFPVFSVSARGSI